MLRHFDEELSALKRKLLLMGGLVESQISGSLRALIERDSALAQQIIENDHRVNALDVEIDEEGKSYLLIHAAKLHNVVKNKDFGEHRLRLTSRSNGFALYSVSFLSCVIPELITYN